MKLNYYPFTLQFRYPFRIAHGERDTTPVVYVEIEENGLVGYGEAAMPPYLPENTETVSAFLSGTALKNFSISDGIESIMEYVNDLQPGNSAAKAAVDIALHDLLGKTKNISLKKIFQTETLPAVYCTYTIGMSSREEMCKKITEANDFHIFKIKLGGNNDKIMIETFLAEIQNSPAHRERELSFCVDVNQGWKKDKYYALEMIHWLSEKGAALIEQPLSKDLVDETAWLTENSPVPIIADEAVQGLSDIEKIKGAYSGINIKLMKCGGLNEAKKMVMRAKELKMKILIGCMSESSCAVTAAAHLSPFADWADLDGPYLVKNDPFDGMKITDGKVLLPDEPGIGIKKR